MHTAVDSDPDRPATAARGTAPRGEPVTDGLLARWLRDQFLALPFEPSNPSQPPSSSHENLAN